jgi:3-oxoisoapionate kinase
MNPSRAAPRDRALPPGVLLAFYGDDFTGSTDAMEVMSFAGLPTVLFLGTPTAQALRRFAGHRAIGIAGTARSRSPDWMDEHLPPVFEALFGLGAPVTQYKVCSTFDSSESVGSIGRAIDLAMPMAGEPWSPMVVGAPQLQRWQAFGQLFAGVGAIRYRLDRHPTMSRHPMTPMSEADLGLHLARQTRRPVARVDLIDMARGQADTVLAEAIAAQHIVSFDVIDDATQAEVGRLIWENRGRGVFSASSSGLQYALVAWWRACELLPPADRVGLASAKPVDRLLVLSGSCSPATGEQLGRAIDAGFEPCRVDTLALVDPARRHAEIERSTAIALRALQQGRDAIVFTARSPDDPAIGALRERCLQAGTPIADAQQSLGDALGEIAARITREQALPRLVFAGGDTSGRILGSLSVEALEAFAPLAKGSPICRTHSPDPRFDGIEMVLKGGQVGGPDFFLAARRGG